MTKSKRFFFRFVGSSYTSFRRRNSQVKKTNTISQKQMRSSHVILVDIGPVRTYLFKGWSGLLYVFYQVKVSRYHLVNLLSLRPRCTLNYLDQTYPRHRAY